MPAHPLACPPVPSHAHTPFSAARLRLPLAAGRAAATARRPWPPPSGQSRSVCLAVEASRTAPRAPGGGTGSRVQPLGWAERYWHGLEIRRCWVRYVWHWADKGLQAGERDPDRREGSLGGERALSITDKKSEGCRTYLLATRWEHQGSDRNRLPEGSDGSGGVV